MRLGAPVALLVLSSCLVTEKQYERVVEERNQFRARVGELEDQLDQAKGKVVELEKALDEAREEVPQGPPEAQVASAYAELKIGRGDQIFAQLETSEGPIRCELFPHLAPTAVLNFVGLAEGTKEWTDPKTGEKTTQKLYDGTKFHRVVPGFMIQGGDPTGTGRGSIGYTFGDEVWPQVRFDRAGVLAMANAGPNTNASQFFVTAAPQPPLNGRYTIFGLCDTETVERIMKIPVGGPDRSTPAKDVVLKTVTIDRKAKTASN
jgi:peptidyl-prolyl cis-trans isomerase A (cyclophilin A)